MLEKEVKEALERILNSKTFSKSTTTNVLLKFLVKSTVQKKNISLALLGEELFGNKYDPEKNDVNIRVNISHLRKRLRDYYENEGRNESLIISIKPGQYYASFSHPKNDNKKSILIKSVVALLLLTGIVILLLSKKETNEVWGSMLDNTFETTFYLCDEFGYYGPNPMGNKGWNRDTEINSAVDFYEHVKDDPKKYDGYQPLNISYINFDNAYTLKPITKYLSLNSYDFSVRSVSDFKTKSIKDRNTIFAGNFITQDSMNELFNSLSENMQIDSKQGQLLVSDSIIDLNSGTTHGEYALTAGLNGPNGTRHHLFYSNHGLGLSAVVEYFTNEDSLQIFSNRYINESEEFICVFFVKGKDRTNISMELVLFDDNK